MMMMMMMMMAYQPSHRPTCGGCCVTQFALHGNDTRPQQFGLESPVVHVLKAQLRVTLECYHRNGRADTGGGLGAIATPRAMQGE